MKTIEFSQRTIVLAIILFVAGFVSLMLTELSKEYLGIIFLCIPACFLAQGVDFEKRPPMPMLLVYGLAFVIYKFDTNLYIAKFIGVEESLILFGWIHWLGVFMTAFGCLVVSMALVFIFNPKFMGKNA